MTLRLYHGSDHANLLDQLQEAWIAEFKLSADVIDKVGHDGSACLPGTGFDRSSNVVSASPPIEKEWFFDVHPERFRGFTAQFLVGEFVVRTYRRDDLAPDVVSAVPKPIDRSVDERNEKLRGFEPVLPLLNR